MVIKAKIILLGCLKMGCVESSHKHSNRSGHHQQRRNESNGPRRLDKVREEGFFQVQLHSM